MWEIIRSNKRKSLILFFGLGFVLIFLGYLIGGYLFGADGAPLGILGASGLWLVLSSISYFSGSKIILGISKARKITKKEHPQLFNVVEEMTIASGLPQMPDVYIINEPAPNAFATGIKPENSAVAVTTGLLAILNRDELQGVIAHEIGHIKNRDVLLMTFAGVMLGSIIMISEVFIRGMFYSGHSTDRYRNRSSKEGGGSAQIIFLLLALLFAVLSPILARLLYFAISRKREYLADASAARFTRYPEGLASALEKLAQNTYPLKSANKVTAAFFIVNPLAPKGKKLTDLTSTHPPISERIRILRNMMHGASFLDYQKAYMKVKKSNKRLIPNSVLTTGELISVRKPSEEKIAAQKKSQRRNIGNLMMTFNNFTFIPCDCGLKLKIPPEYRNKAIKCPKCGIIHDLRRT